MANILKAWDHQFVEYVDSGVFPHTLNRMNIHGYSRTGKSTLTHKLLDSERIVFHTAMPLDDLIGGWALIDGRTVWVDGPAVRALRYGKCLQIDEVNDCPAECQTMLYALLDDPAGVTLPNGERVEAAPGYCVVTTMNPTPEVLPHPIYDRFDIYLKADRLSEGTRKALGPFADNAEAVIAFNQPRLTWTRPASVNAFLAANKLRKAGHSPEKIAEVLGWQGRDLTDFLIAASKAA
jgi:AAA domain (dynein-related subfamily)